LTTGEPFRLEASLTFRLADHFGATPRRTASASSHEWRMPRSRSIGMIGYLNRIIGGSPGLPEGGSF
jgi:hypothetical protein